MVEPMMTARQVAEVLGVHENWVYDQAVGGDLPSYKIGGARRFQPDEVRGWIAEHREAQRERQRAGGRHARECDGGGGAVAARRKWLPPRRAAATLSRGYSRLERDRDVRRRPASSSAATAGPSSSRFPTVGTGGDGRAEEARRGLLRDEINRRVALGAVYPSRPQTFNEFVEGWLDRYRPRPPGDAGQRRDSLKRLAVFAFLAARDDPGSRRRGSRLRRREACATIGGADARHAQDDPARRARARPDGRRGDLPRAAAAPGASGDALPGLAAGRAARLGDGRAVRQPRSVRLPDRSASGRALRPPRPCSRYRAPESARRGGTHDGQIVPTKTTAGRRTVSLSGEALRILREQLLARAPNEVGLVFPAPPAPSGARTTSWLRSSGPPCVVPASTGLRFHDLRHTYAALMVAAGAHPKLLQAQLGHTSINVTLNTYGHLFPDAFADVGEALDRLVHRSRLEAQAADRPPGS